MCNLCLAFHDLFVVGWQKEQQSNQKRAFNESREAQIAHSHIYIRKYTKHFVLVLAFTSTFSAFLVFLTRTSPKRERKQIHFFLFLFPFSFLSGPFWLERIGFTFDRQRTHLDRSVRFFP